MHMVSPASSTFPPSICLLVFFSQPSFPLNTRHLRCQRCRVPLPFDCTTRAPRAKRALQGLPVCAVPRCPFPLSDSVPCLSYTHKVCAHGPEPTPAAYLTLQCPLFPGLLLPLSKAPFFSNTHFPVSRSSPLDCPFSVSSSF